MNKKLTGIVSIVLSILLLMYFETFAYKFISLIGINIYKYSSFIRLIISLVIKLILCFIVYLIYKRDFRHHRNSNNIFMLLLIYLVSLIGIVIVMYLFRYVVNYLGDIFNVKILGSEFYNIFNKRLDINLIVKIVNDYIVTPFLYCSIILLSADKLTKRIDTFTVLSALIASIVYAVNLSGTLGFVIINSLPIFILFLIFSIIYNRTENIWLIIFIYGSYLASNNIILNYLGW